MTNVYGHAELDQALCAALVDAYPGFLTLTELSDKTAHIKESRRAYVRARLDVLCNRAVAVCMTHGDEAVWAVRRSSPLWAPAPATRS